MNWVCITQRVAWPLLLIICLVFPFRLPGAQISSFQAGTGGWQMGTLVVGNIDNDAQLEIVVPYRSLALGMWHLDAFKSNGQRLPGFPYNALGNPINVTPTLADVDADGRDEIIFTAGSNVIALNGENGAVVWTAPVNSANYIPDAGFMAVTNGFIMTPLGLFQPILPPTAQFFSEVSSPLVADVDGDGTFEVLTSWKIDPDSLSAAQDYNPLVNDYFGAGEWGATGEVWSGGVLFHNAETGAKQLVYHFHQLVEAGLALGQAKPGRPYNVYALNDADSVVSFDRTLPPGFLGKGMLHKKFGKNLRLLSGSYQTGIDLTTTDLDGDGLSEVLVPTTQVNPNWQPSETILDDDGAILWRHWKQAYALQNQHGWLNNAVMIPVNPDRDNRIDVFTFTHSNEISFRSWDGTQLVDRAGWPKSYGAFLPTPPVVGDLDGGGDEEIVIGTYDPSKNPSSGTLYIYSLGGALKSSIPVPGGLKHIPTIADIDRDGRNDLIYRALDGKIYIQNFGSGAPELVSWATHLGNKKHDGNFDRNLLPDGSPVIKNRKADGKILSFDWALPAGTMVSSFLIQRAEGGDGPFEIIATLTGGVRSFVDSDPALKSGWLYFYQIVAQYPGSSALSPPFAILSEGPRNLIANGGFEADDDSHWDKWFTGDIPWQNMIGSTIQPHSGRAAMEIKLNNHGNNSTITQSSHYGVPEDYLPLTPGTLYSFGGWIRTSGFTQTSEHWFEWDSSRTGENPNPRPGLPWPLYFTPSLRAETSSPWTYLNRTFAMPAGFPNAELRHRFKVSQAATGSVFLDDVFFREIPAQSSSEWRDLITFGSRWRYSMASPPADWFAAEFNDGPWIEAPAKFGAGTGPASIKTAVTPKLPAYYFRKKFALDVPPASLKEFLIAALCTDDYGGKTYPFDVYLNGKLLPAPGVEAITGEGNIVKYFDLFPFADWLMEGTNTLAIALNNTWQPTWDNVAFDLSVRVISSATPAAPKPKIISVEWQADSTALIDMSGPAVTTWDLQSSDGAIGNWDKVQSIIFNPAGTGTLVDTGQGGRIHPRFMRVRFYRLVQR